MKQRRCIHDEHGNEDPVKAREAAMPRPAAAHKRRKLDSDGNEIPAAKKLRRSTESLAQDRVKDTSSRTVSDAQSYQQAPVANMIQSTPAHEAQEHRQQDMVSAFDQMEAAAAANDMDALHTSLDHDKGDQAAENPPAPAVRSGTALSDPAPDIPSEVLLSHPVASTPPDSKEDIPLGPNPATASEPAASLVSPPASEHQNAGNIPPSPPTTSSRHSSHHPKQQRYTPETASRRASTSSTNDAAEASESGRASSGPTTGGKEVSPMTTISTTGDDEKKEIGLESSAEKRKPRGSMDGIADEESLRLIKELQAEEYGLRRRGRP